MKSRVRAALLAAGVSVTATSAFGGVQRVFRPERFIRSDENVRAVQPIDGAAWIWEKASPRWAEGCMGSGSRQRRNVFAPRFLRFRKAFPAVILGIIMADLIMSIVSYGLLGLILGA